MHCRIRKFQFTPSIILPKTKCICLRRTTQEFNEKYIDRYIQFYEAVTSVYGVKILPEVFELVQVFHIFGFHF